MRTYAYVEKHKRKRDIDSFTKKQIDRWHCERRVAERLGIPYTKKMRDAVLSAIRENRGTFLGKLTNTRSVWKDVVPGFPDIRVIYSKSTHEVVTMLKEEFKLNLR